MMTQHKYINCPYCGKQQVFFFPDRYDENGEETDWEYNKERCLICEKTFVVQIDFVPIIVETWQLVAPVQVATGSYHDES